MTDALISRKSPRQRTLNSGRLMLGAGRGGYDCVIRDMSADGCRVRLSQPTPLPPALELYIPKTGMIHPAEVRWNRNCEAGLQFTGPARKK